MQQLCPKCNAEVAEGKKFCHNCGTRVAPLEQQFEIPPAAPPPKPQISEPPIQAQNPIQNQPPPYAYAQPAPMQNTAAFEKSAKQSGPYAPMGMLAYLGWLVLMCVPVIGCVLTAVFSFVGTNQNRKNLARAMLVLTGVGIAIAATLTILYWEFIRDLKWLIEQNFEITFGF